MFVLFREKKLIKVNQTVGCHNPPSALTFLGKMTSSQSSYYKGLIDNFCLHVISFLLFHPIIPYWSHGTWFTLVLMLTLLSLWKLCSVFFARFLGMWWPGVNLTNIASIGPKCCLISAMIGRQWFYWGLSVEFLELVPCWSTLPAVLQKDILSWQPYGINMDGGLYGPCCGLLHFYTKGIVQLNKSK